MKTFYFLNTSITKFSLIGMLVLVATSCGSFQNSSYYDNDGVYGSNEDSRPRVVESNNSGYYKEYFSNLNKDNEQVFTNVDSYTSVNDSMKKQPEQVTNSNYAGWGSNSNDNITVNVYNNGGWNNWGYYNSWAGNYWGWNNGWYGNNWGWNNWYGPSWGWGWNNWYGPGWGWGWNDWYGPGWYNGFYGGYYGYNYNSWGWYGGNLGHNYAYSGGRRNSNRVVNSGLISGGRNNFDGGRRNSGVFGSRDYSNTSPRSINNNNTPRSNYNQYNTPRTNNNSPRINNNETNTPRSYTPRESTDSPRTYTPSSTPTYSSPRSSGSQNYGGGGGFGGGRSGGGGRR
jgi:hypothetical protein